MYPGLVILTTPAKDKIAPAFLRRANLLIHFPKLTPQQRVSLMHKTAAVNGAVFKQGVDLATVSSTFPLTGRHINRIVSTAVSSARGHSTSPGQTVIHAEHFQHAFQQELK
ncbi:MAG TPA: hypothetical protein VK826_13670, partial [Bacteroidia bacterium]|nr:hypothetical protein [Bacteroidia bacterium]